MRVLGNRMGDLRLADSLLSDPSIILKRPLYMTSDPEVRQK